MHKTVVLDGQRADGFAVHDEGNAHRRTFSKQVSAPRFRVSSGVHMNRSPSQRPTLLGREDPVCRTNAPLSDRFEVVLGGAQECDAARCPGKQTPQTLRNKAKHFFLGCAGVKQASQFADLGYFRGLAAGVVQQAADFLVRSRCLPLRRLTLGNFLLLVKLRKGQPEGEREERGADRHVRERCSGCLFPSIHEQSDAGKHGNQNQVDAEKTEKTGLLGSGSGSGIGRRRQVIAMRAAAA